MQLLHLPWERHSSKKCEHSWLTRNLVGVIQESPLWLHENFLQSPRVHPTVDVNQVFRWLAFILFVASSQRQRAITNLKGSETHPFWKLFFNIFSSCIIRNLQISFQVLFFQSSLLVSSIRVCWHEMWKVHPKLRFLVSNCVSNLFGCELKTSFENMDILKALLLEKYSNCYQTWLLTNCVAQMLWRAMWLMFPS